MKFPVYDYAMDDALEHSEICDEDSETEMLVEYDSADIERICRNHFDYESTGFIQWILAVVLW